VILFTRTELARISLGVDTGGQDKDNLKKKMPSKTAENLHFHKKAQQFFYILKGIATFELEGELFVINEKQGFHIEPNQKHRILNNTESDLEFIVISEPKSHGDRVNL